MIKINRLFKDLPLLLYVLLLFTNSCKEDDNIDSTNGRTAALFNQNKIYGSLTDQDGNVYKTIIIGTQTWMAENLRTTKYRNGEAIPEEKDRINWIHSNTGMYCNYKNTNSADTIATYGRLYNWISVNDSRNIAPTGWHVPTDLEWITLTTYLGGIGVAGGKLKEPTTMHWMGPTNLATNETGFTALPGGFRNGNGFFGYMDDMGYWWSTTDDINATPWYWSLYSFRGDIEKGNATKECGFSIRCLKD